MSQLLSSAVISAVGLTSKAFLNSGLCSVTVSNLSVLLDALRSERTQNGQGLITVSNHLSTLDDPLAWGVLPSKHYTNSRTIRWVLGASDIMFTNPLFSVFFRNGQVIEIFRGKGIWQPAVNEAIEKLNHGHWLHLFGEGKVNQPAHYPQTDGVSHLPRFKWGVGRIIMETSVPPVIIPMWLTGFDKLMPEHRSFPYNFFPKIGMQLGITFGDPIPPDHISAALSCLRNDRGSLSGPSVIEDCIPDSRHGAGKNSRLRGWMADAAVKAGERLVIELEGQSSQIDMVRSEVTAIIQRAVEDLGRKVSGDKLELPLSNKIGRGPLDDAASH